MGAPVSGDSVEARVAPERSIYAKAIDVLHERGHTKFRLEDDATGAVCLNGALNKACHGSSQFNHSSRSPGKCWTGSQYDVLEEAIGHDPAVWNNRAERTLEDVVLLLKYADADELDTWKQLYGPGSLSDETQGAGE